jgi:DNA modification methylase
MNLLYYGDNLDVLRRYIDDETVDLVYLDPPFNSNASYKVLFAEQDGARAASQIKAFEDTWRWDANAARACHEVIEAGGKVSLAMQAFRTFLGESDMLAYLSMMAPRLIELRRVLKSTGSIYLHCDPSASHYLKMLMDAVLGPEQFRNEVVWKRTSAHSSAKRYGPVHDVIFFYGKTDQMQWIGGRQAYNPAYVRQRYKRGGDRPWRDENLTGAGVRHGETGLEWRGFDVTAKGRHWAYPPTELDRMDAAGLIYWPSKSGGWPREKVLLDEAEGVALQDVWTDVSPLNSQAQERLGYPTQKPEALLERIIAASSDERDTVLDPFCGCGTTIAAAQRLKRRWIGIDITSLAISLIRNRLGDAFEGRAKFEVVGEPVSSPDAAKLAKDDPYQFQWWALGLVGARPVEGKKGADKGIDGRIFFHEGDKDKTKQIILSVKAGHVTVSQLRDLRGVLDREKAEIGVLLCMDEPTAPMRKEAASAGFYKSPWGEHSRLQILTIDDLLAGKTIDRPPAQTSVTFKRAPKAALPTGENRPLFGETDPED